MVNSDVGFDRQGAVKAVREHWRFFFWEGVILLVLGLSAMVLPTIASLAIEILVGWLLIMSGVVGLVSTVAARHGAGFLLSLASALAAAVAGILLIIWPQSGVLTLTVILGAFLGVEGIVSIFYALEHRRHLAGRWALLLASGLVDIVLAGLIFEGLPSTAAWAIGLLLGINLIAGGVALMSMALHSRSA
jgi:uncharacterized membrane protein HdeD (DUF308 family)